MEEIGDPYEFTGYDKQDLPDELDQGIFKYQKYEIELKNGSKIQVEKAIGFKPHGGEWTTDLPDHYMSNCHGNIFLGGEYWLNDPAFDKMLLNENPYYEEVSKEDAEFVVLWVGGQMAHSSWIHMDADGHFIYNDKTDHGDFTEFYGDEEFNDKRIGQGYTARYYKSK